MNPLKWNLTACLSLLTAWVSPLAAQEEASHLALLQNPQATLNQKQLACRELARCGTSAAVPVLASLLGDPQLAHLARMALEPIPAPAVDSALREALGTVKDGLLAGVIGSLGVRRDEKAVPALAGFLANPDPDISGTAARALGRIGNAEAAQALQSQLGNASPRQSLELCEGLLRAAESLTAKGQTQQAGQIYDRLASLPQAPHQIRTAAFRGTILSRGPEGLSLLIQALRDPDFAVFASALRVAWDLKEANLTAALAGELAGLSPERGLLIIDLLGKRGDSACAPALLPLAEGGETPVRIAAAKALTRLVHAPAVPVLAKLLLAPDAELAATARDCLASFPGKSADDAVLSLLSSQDATARGLAAGLIAQRSLQTALPALIKTASSDPEESVRVLALKELRDLAGPGELDALLKILLENPSPAVIQAATHVLVALCARQPVSGTIEISKAVYGDGDLKQFADVTKKAKALVKAGATSIEASNGNFGDPAPKIPKQLTVHYSVDGVAARKTAAEGESISLTSPSVSPAVVDPLLNAFARASGPAKAALLRVLQRAGGPKALEAVQSAASATDAALRTSAQRMLCDWPGPEALPAVRALATTPPDAGVKATALRAWFRLIPLQTGSAEEKLSQVQQALALAADAKEVRRDALSALRDIPLPGALGLVVPILDDPSLAEEACAAAVAIAQPLASSHPVEVHPAMVKVAAQTKDQRLADQAAKLARRTQPK